MMKRILFLALCAVALWSCSRELEEAESFVDEVPAGYVVQEFTAGTDDARTSLDGANHTVWAAGDQIRIFWSGDSGTASLISDPGTTSGRFRGIVPDGKTVSYAVYPAAAASSVSGSSVTVTVPAEQAGTFAAGNLSTASVDSGNALSFFNVNAFLCVQITSSDISRIEVESVDGSALAGSQTVSYAASAPALDARTNTSSSISMTAGAAGRYFISVLPGVTHSRGLLLRYFKGAALSGTYYLDRSLSIVRNRVYSFGEFEPDGNYYVTLSGNGKKNGVNWENAFSKDQMGSLLGAASSEVAEEKAAAMAAIKGATFHIGAGTFDFGNVLSLAFDEEEPVAVSFIGEGSDATNISGGDAHACLSFSGKMNVSLSGLNITHGLVSGQPGGSLACSGSGLNLTMTDCRISNNVHPGTASNDAGAGLFLNAAGSFTATRVTFADNSSHHAPALFCYKTDMSLDNCTFSGNTATSWGGAIRIRVGNPVCTFNNCSFNGNSASGDSGCVVMNNGTANFNDCAFTANHCSGLGGAITLNATCTVNISGGSFKGNYAEGDIGEGGAIRLNAGAPVLNAENCTFGGTASGEPNYADADGGALSLKVGTTTLTDCTFIGNYARNDDATRAEPDKGYGGAIDCFSSASLSVSGGSFSGNKAWRGGAVNCSASGTISFSDVSFAANGGSTAQRGGAMRLNTSVDFDGCTFGGSSASEGNEALIGGALYMESGASCSFEGCAFAGNAARTTDDNFGGGALFMRGGARAGISATSFTSNTTASCGGAICAWPQAAPSSTADSGAGALTIGGNSTFSGNHSDKWAGALLYKNKGSVNVSDCVFAGNYAKQDSGALNLDNADASYTFADVIFNGNHADGDSGGVMWIEKGNYSFTDCQFLDNVTAKRGGAVYAVSSGETNITRCKFEGNHSTATKGQNNKEGGAVYVHGPALMKIWKCEFNENCGSKGGAIQVTKDDSDNRPTVFLDACSFYGNHIMYSYGTTINVDYASYFGMNNCSIYWYTYREPKGDTTDMESCWVGLDGIRNAAVVSNCSLIGVPRHNAGGSKANNSALLAVYEGASGKTYLVNDLFLLDQGGPIAVGGDGTGDNRTAYAYYIHHSNAPEKLDFLEGSSENLQGYWKEHTRCGDGDDLATWDEDDKCWKWNGYYVKNGAAKSYTHIDKSSFTSYLNAACPAFVDWLGSDIGKDQLGTDRGSSNWWPGAYQPQATPDVLIKVITWNIRSSEMDDTGDHAWSARRGGMAAFINDRKPQILCMQECESDQRSYLTSNCSGYSAIYDNTSLSWWQQLQGVERSNQVILYKSSDISVQSSGTFWLVSGAPTSPSKSSDQNSYRSCAWMKCTYLGQKMLVMDVHFSYRTKDNSTAGSDDAKALRVKEMNVVKSWIDGHYNASTDGWLLFMGDFNGSHWESIFDEWKDGTYGYFSRDKCPGGSTGRTYNDWDWENGHVGTMDFQFYKGFPSVKSYTIPTETYSSVEYLSDHWPVVVEYRMN